MIKTKSNAIKERVDKRFKDAKLYLKANGFARSIKTLFEDIERCEKKF